MQCALKRNPSTLPKPLLPPTLPMSVKLASDYKRARDKMHLKPLSTRWTAMVEAKAISMREQNESYKSIAEELGLAESSVRYHFQKLREEGEI